MLDLSGASLYLKTHPDVQQVVFEAGCAHFELVAGLSGKVQCAQAEVEANLRLLSDGGLSLRQWQATGKQAADGGDESAAALAYLLRGRLVTWWLGAPGKVLVSFEPLFGAFDPVAAEPIGEGYALSTMTVITHSERGVIISEPMATARVTLAWEALDLLGTVLQLGWKAAGDAGAELPEDLSRALTASGLFRRREEVSPFSVAWTPEAWLMHRSVRDGVLLTSMQSADKRDQVPEARPFATPPPERFIPLPQRSNGGVGPSFYEVMARRRSRREPTTTPLSLAQLGSLLWTAARFRSQGAEGPHGERPKLVPMAGMLGELELYIAANRCAGLDRGFYRYDALGHGLESIAAPSKPFEAMLGNAAQAMDIGVQRPDVLVVFSTRLARLAWKYGALSYRLTLMNLGVMYEALYLAATELGLSPCGVGRGELWHFARLTGRDPFAETSIGEFALSGPPVAQTPAPR